VAAVLSHERNILYLKVVENKPTKSQFSVGNRVIKGNVSDISVDASVRKKKEHPVGYFCFMGGGGGWLCSGKDNQESGKEHTAST
jgi:hypothetical protein